MGEFEGEEVGTGRRILWSPRFTIGNVATMLTVVVSVTTATIIQFYDLREKVAKLEWQINTLTDSVKRIEATLSYKANVPFPTTVTSGER